MVITTPATSTLPGTIEVRAWVDQVVEQHGFGPASTYVEGCWLPLLGPTATWAFRRLGLLVLAQAEPVQLDLVDLSQSLGLGTSLGRQSKLARALVRLARFEVVRGWKGTMAVRRALPPVTQAQLRRLSPSAQAVHHHVIGPPPAA